MMNMDRSQIFRRAWEIKREHKDNVFSLCLKQAWAEAKAPKRMETPEEVIERLESKYSRWTKEGSNGKKYDRIYFNATDLGLEYTTYKTGNIKEAMVNGSHISNCKAYRLLGEKVYFDLTNGKLSPMGRDFEADFGDKIREEIQPQMIAI